LVMLDVPFPSPWSDLGRILDIAKTYPGGAKAYLMLRTLRRLLLHLEWPSDGRARKIANENAWIGETRDLLRSMKQGPSESHAAERDRRRYYSMLHRYRPSAYTGSMVCIVSSEEAVEAGRWQQTACGNADVHQAAADHKSLVSTQCGVTADLLARSLSSKR
jgi:hypothetical protein